MSVKLQIISDDSNDNEMVTNINYISPNLDDGVVAEFARKIMSFSNNTVKTIYKVVTEDVTNAEFME